MSILFDNPPPAIGCGDPGDPIQNGILTETGVLYFDSLSSSDDQTRCTFSAWIKLTSAGNAGGSNYRVLIEANGAGTEGTYITYRHDTKKFMVEHVVGGSNIWSLETADLFRDQGGWYHIYVSINTNEAAESDRVSVVVGGRIISLSGTFPAFGSGTYFGGPIRHTLAGTDGAYGGNAFRHYMAEPAFISGINEDVSSFAYFNVDGAWVPKSLAGKGQGAAVYGVNGFHLDFADPLDLGKDVSGNGNHFTVDGLTADNQVTDTPTNNLVVINSLKVHSPAVFSEGNRSVSTAVASLEWKTHELSFPLRRGRFYIELEGMLISTDVSRAFGIGIRTGSTLNFGSFSGYYAGSSVYEVGLLASNSLAAGQAEGITHVFNDGVAQSTRSRAINGPFRLRMAIDVEKGHVYLGDQTGWYDDPASGVPTWSFSPDTMHVLISTYNDKVRILVDASEWSSQPPAAYQPISSSFMPCPDILNPDDFFTIRQSAGGADITDLPWDTQSHKTLVISKRTDAAQPWRIHDTVRGAGLPWVPNPADPEITTELDGLTAFTNGGYIIGADAPYQGSRIDYIFRASPKSGFDILTLDHVNGIASTCPHLAGGAIDYAWVIPLDGGDRRVFHSKLPAGNYLMLNENNVGTDAGWFSSTANTVSLGASMPSGRYILYVWRAVPQFSAFEVHAGTGDADGAMVPVDFQPRAWLCKRDGIGQHTAIQDAERNPENPATQVMYLRLDNASSDTGEPVDFVSNGAKTRSNSIGNNASGSLYYSALWAKTPGKFARAR